MVRYPLSTNNQILIHNLSQFYDFELAFDGFSTQTRGYFPDYSKVCENFKRFSSFEVVCYTYDTYTELSFTRHIWSK